MTVSGEAVLSYEAIAAEMTSVSNYSAWSVAPFPVSSIVLRQPNELTDEAREVLSKIRSFSRLGENWDSYGAARPSKIALQNAFSFVKQLARLQVPVFFAAPGPSGEALVELQGGNKSIEVTFEPDGVASYSKFIGVDCVEEGTLDNRLVAELAQWVLP